MAKIIVNGRPVTVDDSFLKLSPEEQDATVDEIAGSLPAQTEAPAVAPAEPVQAQQSPISQMYRKTLGPAGEAFSAATEGSQAGLMAGWDDEIGAAMTAPVTAAMDWYKSGSFDLGSAYQKNRAQLEEFKTGRRQAHPIASTVGEVAGGMTGGGFAGRAGLTVMGRTVPVLSKAAPRLTATGAAALEGAGWGALTGAGEAKTGERLAGAGKGAAIGAVTGGAVQGLGNVVASRLANRAAAKAAPSTLDLQTTKNALYDASEAAGMTFKQSGIAKLKANMKIVAGDINPFNRPMTAGHVADIDVRLQPGMTLRQLDEVRQSLGADIKAAKGYDKTKLIDMKKALDSFLEHIDPADHTGGVQAVSLIKEARKITQRMKKSELIEGILEDSEVAGAGKYTQSGFNNALTLNMRKLWRQIQKGQSTGWTKQEVELIKQMAKGGSNSKLVNLFAKFAPRGPVSILASQIIGTALPLPPMIGNAAMWAGGEAFGRMAEAGAQRAGEALRSGVASGVAPQIISRPATGLGPAIAGGAIGATELERATRGQ